jgi:hypothetical protein
MRRGSAPTTWGEAGGGGDGGVMRCSLISFLSGGHGGGASLFPFRNLDSYEAIFLDCLL